MILPFLVVACLLPLQAQGKVNLELYTADRATLIGPMVNDMVIDLAETPSMDVKASAKCHSQSPHIGSVSFFMDGELVGSDSDSPYWLMGDNDDAWALPLGNHTVAARAYCSSRQGGGREILESSVRIYVVDETVPRSREFGIHSALDGKENKYSNT
jgi:hypothetical protein